MKIGLYFGSFNPIHHGHLIIANYVLQNTELNQVWLVVSPQNPLKKSSNLLNEYNRLYLAQIAVEDEQNLRVSNVEFKLPKPSYTIDTLNYLNEQYPKNEFFIIMGSDSLQNLPKWKNWELIAKKYKIYVYPRPNYNIEELPKYCTMIKAPMLEISSTQIREMIKQKKSIRYWLPDNVKEEIERNGYYK